MATAASSSNVSLSSAEASVSTQCDSRGRGRPKLNIDRDRLQYLCSLHFTWEEIAVLFEVSAKTIQRRAKEFGINKYTQLSDSSLDCIISGILSTNPAAGEIMLTGHLSSMKVSNK